MAGVLTATGYGLTLIAALYALAALVCRARTYRSGIASPRLPVTVLKPLCGAEPRLEANLATLCEQQYPAYQLLFGVRDPQDPAVEVVRRLRQRFPDRDIELVIDARVYGSNLKVSNLINMSKAIRHPWLVLADSDISVDADYLDKATAPLADPMVGIVTCLYRGEPLNTFWSRMGALFIDTWFAPSVRVASAFGGTCFGFGATIALRTETLHAIGGFHAIRNQLADDFWLGKLTRERGLRTVLPDLCVTTDVTETSFASLWSRERRWMQTIRTANPLGYTFSFVTFTFPLLASGLALAPTGWNAACAMVGMAARLGLHWRKPHPGHAGYAILRDCLLLLAWAAAFFGSTVHWREQTVRIKAHDEGATR